MGPVQLPVFMPDNAEKVDFSHRIIYSIQKAIDRETECEKKYW